MAKRKHTYHYLYKTTCLINQKFYIGIHSTSKLTDGYIGSGRLLWRSIRKYGKENFKVEILEFFNDRISLKNYEREIVNEELLKDPLCMNLSLGGYGGWNNPFINVQDKNGLKLKINRNDPLYLSGELISIYKNRLVAKDKEGKRFMISIDDPRYLSGELVGNTKGSKFHSQEFKDMISLQNSKLQSGEGNSQFGKCWVYNLDLKQSKSIKKENINLYLTEGWIKGRKMFHKE